MSTEPRAPGRARGRETPEEYAAAPWDEAGYTVATVDGLEAVEGVACWPFGARPTRDTSGAGWTLTHVPSGRSVAVLSSLDDCQRVARDLVARAGGTEAWDFDTATDLLEAEHRDRLYRAWADVVAGSEQPVRAE